jgi:hypothetical protein
MSPSNRRGRGMFVPLQANYFMDEAIKAVGNRGELAYLRSLAVAKLVDRDGELSLHQLGPVKARIRQWDDVVGALLEHKLWLPAQTLQGYCIRSWQEHNESRVEREVANALEATRRELARERAGMSKPIDVSGRTASRKRREEKRELGTDRTPSGSVRSVPARAAPRTAEGAARPAPGPAAGEVVMSETDIGPPDGMTAAEWARMEAEKGRQKNPAAGRQFSYRPQLPTSEPTGFQQVMDRLNRLAEETTESDG